MFTKPRSISFRTAFAALAVALFAGLSAAPAGADTTPTALPCPAAMGWQGTTTCGG
jgi:hypothetical protein